MAGNVADIGGVTDPRLGVEADAIGSNKYDVNTAQEITPGQLLYDNSVTFEEYHHYAQLERAYEATHDPNESSTIWSVLSFGHGKKPKVDPSDSNGHSSVADVKDMRDEKSLAVSAGNGSHSPSSDRSAERGPWATSADDIHTMGRAARTASWGAVFYLITTDILGPFSVPWSIAQLGYGPGAALYTVFAVLAAYSGLQVWQVFLGLDSAKYPCKNYGDLAFRLFGKGGVVFRWVCNILQEFQFFVGVALLILTTGQSLGQMSAGPNGSKQFCFTACLIIMTAVGMIIGQIRTLQKLGWLANCAVWLNLLTIFITMGVVAHSPPNWAAVTASYGIKQGPIYHTGNLPPGLPLTSNITGLMQAVYSYGGATLFCELIAEMKRPWDFWKGLICADLLIFCAYLIFGMFVYSYQGQATFNPAYQGVDPYKWQTVCNSFQLVTSLVAAALYGNIGIKVLYNNVGRTLLRFPALETKGGKIIWAIFAPIYWACAFILVAGVPQVSNLSAFVGAAAIMQFSYTFPPLLMIAYNINRDTMGTFDPATGTTSVRGYPMKRILTGFFKRPLWNIFNTIYLLGALTTAILGLYSSGVGMRAQFAETTCIKAFSCDSPTSNCDAA